MGACATKPGDLKVKGETPLVLDDAAEKKAGVVETDPAADGSRRRSLSELLKENADSDVEAPEEAEKKVEPATAAADDTGATEEQLSVQPSVATTEQDHTAEERGAKAVQDPHTHAPVVVEEEKRVDPDSVQVADVPAPSVEESSVDPDSAQVADVPAQSVEESSGDPDSAQVAAVPAPSVGEGKVVADACV
ncbi:hypothetical protein ACQ4PT_014550 [Festuca glaucescens]